MTDLVPEAPEDGAPTLLEPGHLVRTASEAGHPGLDAAHLASRSRARSAHPWLRSDPVPGPDVVTGDLPDADSLRRLLLSAAASGVGDISVCDPSGSGPPPVRLPTRSWTVGATSMGVPDPLTLAQGLRTGGLALGNGERWDASLADLADEVERALDANVRIAVVTGRVGVEAFGDGSWEDAAVVALGGNVDVRVGGGDVIDVPDGMGCRFRSLVEVEVAAEGVALVLGLRLPVLEDLWALTVEAAGHWPRARLDLPHHPMARSEVYGIDEPVHAVDVVLDVLRQDLLGADRARQHLAWWRANILPASRPLSMLPSSSTGAGLVVRGRLPGGIGFLDRPGAPGLRAAAGSWTFAVPVEAIQFLEGLLSGACPAFDELDALEEAFAQVLVDLGLATLERRPG